MPQDHPDDRAASFPLIALGSNSASPAGGPAATVRAALARLAALGFAPLASSLWLSPCFPPGAGPDFVNAAARLRHAGTPEALLAILHAVEAEFGRSRRQRWAARSLDLDLIGHGDAVRPDPATQTIWRRMTLNEQLAQAPDRLILPHPRLHERAFVLVPLAEVAPQWRHPVTGQSVIEMRDGLAAADIRAMRRVEGT